MRIGCIRKSILKMYENSSCSIKILKRNQTEVLEMKDSMCQVKNIVENLYNRLVEAQERYPN